MTPFAQFELVWARCDELSALHSYFSSKATAVLKFDELLRAEWVARVSALDLYVHELVTQQLVQTFKGERSPSNGFKRFGFTGETLLRTRDGTLDQQASVFELDVRNRLSFMSFQDPEKIADGIRFVSDIELWNELAALGGADARQRTSQAKAMKLQLSAVVDRRNKIAHEGDLKPGVPRVTWEIQAPDLLEVAKCLKFIVAGMEQLVWRSAP